MTNLLITIGAEPNSKFCGECAHRQPVDGEDWCRVFRGQRTRIEYDNDGMHHLRVDECLEAEGASRTMLLDYFRKAIERGKMTVTFQGFSATREPAPEPAADDGKPVFNIRPWTGEAFNEDKEPK